MLQQNMKKNNLEVFSKDESSTLLASTDENISQEQSGHFIKSQKEHLILKIKKLEIALAESKREQQILVLKQAHLIEAVNAKKNILKTTNEKVVCFVGHKHIKQQLCHRKTVSSTQSQAVGTSYLNQHPQQQNTRYCAAGHTSSNKSSTRTYKFRENIQANLNFTHSSSHFQKSYLKRSHNQENLGQFHKSKNSNRYESIEEIWNQQRSQAISRFRKNTIKAQNE